MRSRARASRSTARFPRAPPRVVALNLTVTDAAACRSRRHACRQHRAVRGCGWTARPRPARPVPRSRCGRTPSSVGAAKSFDPNLVIAGEPTTVTIGGTNTSTIPIDSLTLTEPSSGSFPAEYTFGGFTGPVAWPAGATSGTVVYHLADGEHAVGLLRERHDCRRCPPAWMRRTSRRSTSSSPARSPPGATTSGTVRRRDRPRRSPAFR